MNAMIRQGTLTIRREGNPAVPSLWRREALSRAAAATFFVAATLAATIAQYSDRPITAAILYLLGVTIVGALEGLRGGLVAAVLASLTYNFFLSEPIYRFSLASADDYVPLVAFNLCAAASGLVAGRLKDRALAAESATRRMLSLFELSQKLQAAVAIGDISEAVADYLGIRGRSMPEIYVAQGSQLPPAMASSGAALARHLLESDCESLTLGGLRGFLIKTSAAPRAVLVVPAEAATADRRGEDMGGFLNLLSIAVERCLLLEQLSEAELLRRSEEFKTALLSSESHDLRTPLSAISASASSLASYGADLPAETRADLLLMIQEQCERLNRYTTNLLNLVRLRSGVDSARFTECDALDVLGTAISRARAAGDGRTIRKDYEVPSAIVRADPVMLEQVFYNVLENAVRYSPEEAPIRVAAFRIAGRLSVLVEDRGAGIAESDLERVFERFYRSQSGPGDEGSGLGLSIAKGFTEAFGGSIEALRLSADAGGTRIKIDLPLSRNEEA